MKAENITPIPLPTVRRKHPPLIEIAGADTTADFDLIWNQTLICGWDCSVCCVDAVHVSVRDGDVVMRSAGLAREERYKRDRSMSVYDQALKFRQDSGLELTLSQKLRVLDHLTGFDVQLDISGGDPLAATENVEFLAEASHRLGRHRLTLTATGAGLVRRDPLEIGSYIKELNFTFDGTADPTDPNRPNAYATGNLRMAKRYRQMGVRIRAECPLTKQNSGRLALTRLYRELHEAGVDTLLVMRLFPSGRGNARTAQQPSRIDYENAINVLRDLEHRYGTPEVKLQCALKAVEGYQPENPCDAVVNSFGITATGMLLGSPWAIGPQGEPQEDWLIGSLLDSTFDELLSSPKVREFMRRAHENHGHCKYLATLNSSKVGAERFFDRSDPLYEVEKYEEAG